MLSQLNRRRYWYGKGSQICGKSTCIYARNPGKISRGNGQQLQLGSNEFFDYDAKYKGEVDEITPARIPDELRDKIQAETLRLYDIIGANGIIRVDWIITEGNKLNLLEVNTTPGMTATSFIPQQVRAAGLDIKDVLTDIIENKL